VTTFGASLMIQQNKILMKLTKIKRTTTFSGKLLMIKFSIAYLKHSDLSIKLLKLSNLRNFRFSLCLFCQGLSTRVIQILTGELEANSNSKIILTEKSCNLKFHLKHLLRNLIITISNLLTWE
jgi:hypothetical protein